MRLINSIEAKILVPFVIAALVISLIGVYLLYTSTNDLALETAYIKLINGFEMFTDYQLKYVDDDQPWEEINDVFYWDWRNDDYSIQFIHDSDFGFAVFEYDESKGVYELMDDMDSGVARVFESAPDLVSQSNSEKLNKNHNLLYRSTEMGDDGELNIYYWLLVSQSDETMRPGARKKAFAMVYNETQSANELKLYYMRESLYMIFPAFVFTVIIGIIIGKFTRKIQYVSRYVKRIRLDNIPDEPLDLHTHDELRDMADSVNTMVAGLRERERMSDELTSAASIQSSMLIQKFPAFPDHNEFDIYATMTPAKEVGGDFYDMFMIDEKHLAIVIADVSDKGVPAALFMAMTKSLIKYHLRSATPANVLKSVNKFLCEGNDTFMFVTCFVGILDLETGEFTYANAGHNPPLVKSGIDGKYEFLNVKKNIVLAIYPSSNYEDEKIVLPHGSKILLYTDGVTEAINKAHEQYQEERLVKCVSAHDNDKVDQVLPAILDDIKEYRGEEAQFDDITMLMVEYH